MTDLTKPTCFRCGGTFDTPQRNCDHTFHDKPTVGLTDEQIDRQIDEWCDDVALAITKVSSQYRIDLRVLTRQIEAIVRKNCEDAIFKDLAKGHHFQAVLDEARKDERERIATYVRTHRAAYSNKAPHHIMIETEPDVDSSMLADAILRGDEPDDQDACDMGDA